MPAHRAVLLPVLLVLACFTEGSSEAGSDPTGDEDPGTSNPTGGMSTSGPTTTVGMSSTTVATGDATTIPPADTTDPTDASTGTSPCGVLGAACCEDDCMEGTCYGGTCVTFGGAYLDGELCDECPRALEGPVCGCPEGLTRSPPFSLLSSGCIKTGKMSELPWVDESFYFCEGSYVPGASDWAGAYLQADIAGAGCVGAPDCLVPNPNTNACTCPDGAELAEVRLFAHCGDIPDPPPAYRLGFCFDADVPPITFGGVVYAEGPDCLVEHPETGDCDCPDGWAKESFRVISSAVPNLAGDLGICVRQP